MIGHLYTTLKHKTNPPSPLHRRIFSPILFIFLLGLVGLSSMWRLKIYSITGQRNTVQKTQRLHE